MQILKSSKLAQQFKKCLSSQELRSFAALVPIVFLYIILYLKKNNKPHQYQKVMQILLKIQITVLD